MTDDETPEPDEEPPAEASDATDGDVTDDETEKSFRERVEEIRERANKSARRVIDPTPKK